MQSLKPFELDVEEEPLGFDLWADPDIAALPPIERLRTPMRLLGTRNDHVLVELKHSDAVTEFTLAPAPRPGTPAITRHLFALACESAVIGWCPTCLRSAVEGIVSHSDGCQRSTRALGSWLLHDAPVRVIGRRVRRMASAVALKGNAALTIVEGGESKIRQDLASTDSGGHSRVTDPFSAGTAWSSGAAEVSTTTTEMHA
jgi:hypothetical protein